MGAEGSGTDRSHGSRAGVVARMRRSFSRLGVAGTVRMRIRWGLWRINPALFYRASHFANSIHERLFDWHFDTDTRSTPKLHVADAPSESRGRGNPYEATDPWTFACIVRALRIEPREFTFVDLGCGKGRSLLMAARQRFAEVIGVEHSASLVRLAERNIRRYQQHRPSIPPTRCDLGDARDYAFPQRDLVVYLFNPFDGKILAQVLDRVKATHDVTGNRLYVVYVNPVHAEVCVQNGFLELIRVGEGVLQGEFQIYGNREAMRA